MVNFGEVRRVQLANSTLLSSTTEPLGSFQVCSDCKERMGCGKQREAPHQFIFSKAVNLVPEFAVEELPLDRTAALVLEFAVKDLSLGRII